MRTDVKESCVTTWGAVLEFRGWRYNGKDVKRMKMIAHIADPNAIDSGQYIRADEIVLIVRKKQTNDRSKLPAGAYINASNSLP